MPSLSSQSLLCIITPLLLCNLVSARHIHGHRMHRHHVRPLATPTLPPLPSTAVTSADLPAVTEGDAVIADVQEIQNGLNSLPADILNFIQAVEQRLQGVESVLSSLLSGAPATSSASATDYLPIPASTTSISVSTSSVSLCQPFDGALTLVPCYVSNGPAPYTAWNHSGNHHHHASGSSAAPWPLNTGSYPSGFNITAAPAPYASGIPPATGTYSPQPSPSTYTFQADADNNVAVYYGTAPDTQAGGLLTLCENANVDIVILSFVYDFFTQGGYPSINFGPGCTTPNEVQATSAPGLMDCTALAPEITGCQQIGKKVLISLGGYIANSTFTSDTQATQFAQTLWNLFGAGTAFNPALRPFGPGVVVDGFDIDNENHLTTSYDTFASALREQFLSDPTKTYYLSAAPQCPIPDASIPLGAMAQADFVWVQFYNNPACNLDSAGFQASFAAWSANLSAVSATPGRPRVYIGAGAFEGAGSGYVEGAGLAGPVGLARELYVGNLGGVMLWDGSEAAANVDGFGVDYLEYAKAALQG